MQRKGSPRALQGPGEGLGEEGRGRVGECRPVQPLWTAVWSSSKKIRTAYDPVIPLAGIYPRKFKTVTREDVYICLRLLQRYSQLPGNGSS